MSVDERLDGRTLVVRADATAESGTGHLMRTLALTQAWIDLGGRARWLVAAAPPALEQRIAAEGIEIVRLAVTVGSPADAEAVREALHGAGDARAGDARAVIDGPEFGPAYLATFAEVAGQVVVVDDLAERPTYPVGLVLNQNAHADRAGYPPDATCRFLLGIRYVLLRREFVRDPAPRTTPEFARRVLVTFGGSDPTGMTARTIAALRLVADPERRALEVRVLVGSANQAGAAIEAAVAGPGPGYDVEVLRDVDDMPAQFAWADLAITSGGSTVWELARTGVPALVVETVPAERLLVTGLARLGLFGHLGPEAALDAATIASAVSEAVRDAAWRDGMATLGRRLIDGQGARRVVAAIRDDQPWAEEAT